MSYTILTSTDEVDRELAAPGPLWLFKHSSACGTSSYAKEMVDAYLVEHPDERAAMVVIQDHRDVSNHIAAVLSAVHKSPQLFLVVDGKVAWGASHFSITGDAMAAARAEAA